MSNLATIVNNILADSGIDDINVVVTTGSYSNPSWITALSWTKITDRPTTLAGYGITDAYTQTQVNTLLANYVPYSGATSSVNLGTHTLSANNLIANGGFNSGSLMLKPGTGAQTINLDYFTLTPSGTTSINFGFSTGASTWKSFSFSSVLLTNNTPTVFTLPNGGGTIAVVGGSGVGTVTSVAALTLGTSGTDLSSSVANGTTTPVITLNVPTASAANRGALSAADWTTFNNKQNALTNPVTGTGTTNFLPKFTGASTIGNSAIQDDGSSVLIGRETFITGTNAYFQVGNAAGATGKFQIESTSGAAIIGTRDDSSILFRTNLTTKLTLNSAGNLGLGVTPSAWGSAYKAFQFGTTGAIFGESGDAANYFTTNTFVDSVGFKYITSDWALGYFQENGVHSWRTAPSGTAGNAISFTQAMTLDASGRLGIGTPSPTQQLETTARFVIGNAVTGRVGIFGQNTATADTYITIQNTAGNFDIGTSSGGHYFYGIGSLPLQFYTNSTEKMRIFSDGNVFIGSSPSNNGARLQVSGTASVSGVGYFGGSASLVTSTGILTTSANLQMFIGSAASNATDKMADVILANNNSFTTGTIGRLIGVNTAVTTADKRIAQIAFNLDGAINSGAIGFATLSAGTFATRLTIASTGAATFSSSVTATNGIFSLTTTGGAIGSVRNLTLANTSGTLNDFAGINFAYYNNTTNFAYIGSIISNVSSNSAADLVFGVKASNAATSVSEYMRIKFGGNVGIGTDAPSTILDVRASAPTLTLRDSRTSATWSAGVELGKLDFFTSDVTGVGEHSIASIKAIAGGVNTASPDGNLIFSTGFYNEANPTERMRINSSGQVGIANASPSYVLDVISRVAGEGGVRFWNNRGSTSTIDSIALNLHVSNSIGQTGGKIVVAENTTDSWLTNMQFWVNGASSSYSPTQAMTITSSGNVLIGTTTTPTAVSGVSFPLTLSSSAATRLRIDSTNASPNSGVGLYANGVQKFSFAMYGATSDFTIYNDALLAPSVTVKGNNSNVLIGTTDDNGSKLRVAGGIGFFDSGIRTGTLDTGYVSGIWKLGRAVIGSQPGETHQIIVEINGALFTIGAAAL